MPSRIVAAVALVAAFAAPVRGQSLTDETPTPSQPSIEEGVDYRVYDRAGNPSSMSALVMAAMGDDVLLVGEEHDDMIGHSFETTLFEMVLAEIGAPTGAGRPVVLSLEMFERDVQYIVDEYLAGEISEDHFLRSGRPWDDYEARYRPLVEAARVYGAPVVAANAPRRYVSRVTAHGPESLADLSAQARAYLPPLPYPGPSDSYREQWDALMTAAMLGMEAATEEEDGEGAVDAESDEGHGGDAESEGHDEEEEGEAHDDDQGEEAGHQEGLGSDHTEGEEDEAPARGYEMNPNAIYSQSLWDASMGHAITEALVRHIGAFVVHFAGSFHVAEATGIPERVSDYRPGTRVTTVVMTKVDDIEAWSAEEHGPLADFVVLTQLPDDEGDEGN